MVTTLTCQGGGVSFHSAESLRQHLPVDPKHEEIYSEKQHFIHMFLDVGHYNVTIYAWDWGCYIVHQDHVSPAIEKV